MTQSELHSVGILAEREREKKERMGQREGGRERGRERERKRERELPSAGTSTHKLPSGDHMYNLLVPVQSARRGF